MTEYPKYYDFWRFVKLWNRLHDGRIPKIDPLYFNAILDFNYQNNRFYHALGHIEEGLEEFDEVKDLLVNPDELELAWRSHDVIYNTHKTDNERRSAELVSSILKKSGASEVRIKKIVDLILVTDHKTLPKDSDEGYIVDIDLTIFGKSIERYKEYVGAVRKEYFWVNDGDFAKGRTKILNYFLERPQIYYTEFFRKKYDAHARINIKREIQELSAQV